MIRPLPKPPFPQPKPLRLLKEGKVTIAAGFRCNDGIVLCADSLHTISGYVKHHEGKIDTCAMEDFVIAIAGAGTTDYIRTAVETITRPGLEFIDLLQIEIALRDRMLEFFGRHLLPWSNFPESERPMVELLIAVTGKKKTQYHGLFHYAGTSFHRVYEKAIGAGILLADSLIAEHIHSDRVHRNPQTLPQLCSLAVFILSKVKKHVDGCGGYTDLVILDKAGGVAFVDSGKIEELERVYQTLERKTLDELEASIVQQKLPDFLWIGK
jgi:20S proteasome alpha/beta subunit